MERRKQKVKNIVGKQVGRIRYSKNLTQESLAAKCQIDGLDISRVTVAKLEAGHRTVTDWEVFKLAKVLKVSVLELFPKRR